MAAIPCLPHPLRLLAAALLALSVAAAVQAADAPPACHYAQWPALPLEQTHGGALIIDGTINQAPVHMLVDTAASTTQLMRTTADRLGLSLTRIRMTMVGVGGRASVFRTKVDDIGIGDMHAQDKRFAVLDSHHAASADVLLGTDFLFQKDLEIALAEQQIRFFQADGCDDKFLAYWDPKASEIALDSRTNKTRRPTIAIQLNGVTLQAIIDTGAQRSLIGLEAARRAGVTPQSPGVVPTHPVVGIGSAVVPVWNATFDTFAIGDETIKRAEIGIADLQIGRRYGSAPDMLLGRDFLLAHRLLFAFSQNRLYFSYLGGPVFTDALAGAVAAAPPTSARQ